MVADLEVEGTEEKESFIMEEVGEVMEEMQ